MKKQKEVQNFPVTAKIMQPTVINESNPIDLNYLYLILSKNPADFGFPNMTELMDGVTKLGEAFVEDKQPGSGMYAKCEVDLRAADLLVLALKLVIARKIDIDFIAKRVLFPMKPVITVAEMDPETKSKIINAVNEHFPVDFSDGMDPKLTERLIDLPEDLLDMRKIKQYPMRPEESLSPEDIIE